MHTENLELFQTSCFKYNQYVIFFFLRIWVLWVLWMWINLTIALGETKPDSGQYCKKKEKVKKVQCGIIYNRDTPLTLSDSVQGNVQHVNQ